MEESRHFLAKNCHFIHCLIVDYYRREFLAHALDKTNPIHEDLEFFSGELKKLKKRKGKYLEKIMIIFYLGYSKLQLKETNGKKKYPQKEYYKSNKHLLLLWNWIGPSTHTFTLILASFLYNPMIFFYYILVLANVWMLVLLFFQVRINKKIALKEG